jgi:hypothetical protein
MPEGNSFMGEDIFLLPMMSPDQLAPSAGGPESVQKSGGIGACVLDSNPGSGCVKSVD